MKNTQLNIRLTKKEKEQIDHFRKINGYDSMSSYIVDSAMNRVNKNGNIAGKIVTLSLSPAIDYIIDLDAKKLNELTPNKFNSNNRAFLAAGKGIHESIIIDSFGVPTLALHYSGGFTGDLLEKEISKMGIDAIRFNSEEETRINIKLNVGEKDKKNYELSEKPPLVNEVAKEKFRKTIEGLSSQDTLSIAGSFNPSDFKFLEEICSIANKKKVKLVFDLSSKDILKLLKYKPFLIKPNIHELETIFETKIDSIDKTIKYMQELSKLGTQNVAITLGGDGALLLTSDGEVYKAEIIKPIELISPQGAGDSFVGAFLAKSNIDTLEECFKWANAAGAATAANVGLAGIEEIKSMFDNIQITKINI